jgi:plastocyanin
MSEQRRTRRQFIVGVGSVTTIGLAGCAGSPSSEPDENGSRDNTSGSDSHDSPLDGPKSSATVSMTTKDDGSHFEPHVVWVEQGGTVTWKLESGTHTSTAYSEAADRPSRIPDGASGWDSGTLSEAGATFDHTFETAGVYDYFCAPHEQSGMIGTVIVGEPDPAGQPGLQPPQESLPSGAASKIESLNQRVQSALGGGSGGGTGSHSHGGGNGSTTHGGNETGHSDH